MTTVRVRPRRSLLFVPGLRPERYAKALESGADVVCIDLEDAVALPKKAEARELTFPLFAQDSHPEVEKMVRINALSTLDGLKDLQKLLECGAPPAAIMIPKVRAAAEIELLDRLLQGSCRQLRFCVIIETNDGLHNVLAIAKSSARIDSMILGAVDMSADLRCEKSWEALLYARSRLVHAAASAGIDLLDVPFLALEDTDGLRRESEASARLGFTGKAAIHPNQLPTINAAFTPSEVFLAKARKCVAAFQAEPSGLVVVDGELIELPVIRSMQRAIVIAERVRRTAS